MVLPNLAWLVGIVSGAVPELNITKIDKSALPPFQVFLIDLGWVAGFCKCLIVDFKPVMRVYWHGKAHSTKEQAESWLDSLVKKKLVSRAEQRSA